MLLALLALVAAGCEKVVFENETPVRGDSDGNVRLHVSAQTSGTRSEVALSEVCGRLNVAVFDADGKKVKSVAQVVGDGGYGTIGLALQSGQYTVVAVAHNCTGTATITSPAKVTFQNNKVTDTFFYCGPLAVTGEKMDAAVSLHRGVAMVRVKFGDAMDDVAQLRFYYLGGSSTLSPEAGYGCVNSKQTEYRACNEDGVYDIYTMPHADDDVLTRVTVTALDSGDNVVGECVLEDVPVKMGYVTECSGSMCGGGGVSLSLTADPEWAVLGSYSF